jgi:Carboxypeptidase regulatory-like domain/TonB-dependent Receptor Plug Domain/Gram-negative bacterial TonB protein C-terminal
MRKSLIMSVCHAPIALLMTALLAGPIASQEQGVVSGTVSDSAGDPIFRAELALEGLSVHAFTDEHGIFNLEGLPLGSRVLTARRLGFAPSRLPIQVSQSTTVPISVVLSTVPSILPPVIIRPARLKYSGRLAEYYKRLEKRSSGYFITREQIDHENSTTLGALLQHAPGIRIGRGAAGITGMRMRGRACWPLVWIDGTPMPAGETDLDAFIPSTIQGIELYLGSTTAPMRYIQNGDASSCGTVLIWSRGPDTDPVGSAASSADLEDLIDRRAIYSADSVDRAARLDTTRALQLDFPASLFAAHVPGMVIAEFVVDTLGRVEYRTVGIVASTAPLFSDAVRVALHGASYIPASKGGHPVRQLVQQPFEFNVAGPQTAGGQPEKLEVSGRIKN